MKLSALIQEYLRSLIYKDISPLTYRDYSHYLERYLTFAGDIDTKEINELGIAKYRNYLAKYVDQESGLSLKRNTQNYFLTALRVLLSFAKEKGVSELDKSSVPLVKVSKSNLEIIDQKSFDILLNAPDPHTKKGLRDKTILEVLLSTGMLVSEVSSLNRDQVDLDKKEITFVGKGGKKRTIYLFERCVYWLERYLMIRKDGFRPLFIRFQGSKTLIDQGGKMHLTTRSIERIVEKYAKAVGLAGKVSPQTFRNFLGASLFKEGLEPATVQRLLGLKSSYRLREYLKELGGKNFSSS